MKNFFDLGSKLVSTTVRAPPIDLDIDTNKLIRGEYNEINFPVIFKQKYGKNFQDVLDTEHPSLYLISDKFKTVLEENFLTGWQIYPIKFHGLNGQEISGYHGFSVVGRCGPIDYTKSEIIQKKIVPEGSLCEYYKGLYFENWDGSDFFIPSKTSHVFITKKAANILKKNKITNVRLENLYELETPDFMVKILNNRKEIE